MSPALLIIDLKFSGPHCGQHLECEQQFSGREIQCPACQVLLRIPPVPGKTVEYQPESGKTWATFLPGGRMAAPAGLRLNLKQNGLGK